MLDSSQCFFDRYSLVIKSIPITIKETTNCCANVEVGSNNQGSVCVEDGLHDTKYEGSARPVPGVSVRTYIHGDRIVECIDPYAVHDFQRIIKGTGLSLIIV